MWGTISFQITALAFVYVFKKNKMLVDFSNVELSDVHLIYGLQNVIVQKLTVCNQNVIEIGDFRVKWYLWMSTRVSENLSLLRLRLVIKTNIRFEGRILSAVNSARKIASAMGISRPFIGLWYFFFFLEHAELYVNSYK